MRFFTIKIASSTALIALSLSSIQSALAQQITTIGIVCENNQLVVQYNLAEGDNCVGERVEIVNGEVTRFPLLFTESRDRPPRALSDGDLVSVNGFLECINDNTGLTSRVSSAAASQTGCAGGEEQTEELQALVATETANQQDLDNEITLLQLQASNDLEASLCEIDGESDACIAARQASDALRETLGIQ